MSQTSCIHPPDKIWSLDDFQIGCVLGSGMFGKVYLAKEKKSGYILALKMMYKSELIRHKMQRQLRREIEIQTRLR